MRHLLRYFLIISTQLHWSSVCARGTDEQATINSDGVTCTILRWDEKGFNKPRLDVRKPGRYCLDRDYDFTCFPWSHGCGGEFISIRGEDIDVDLRGHALNVAGTKGYTGIWGAGRNIRVHNGVIRGAGTGVYLVDALGKAANPVYATPASAIEDSPSFALTNFTVENIRFINVYNPIIMSGSGNVVRGNDIEAILANNLHDDGSPKFAREDEPKVAVLNYGANILIEGNRFRQETNNKGITAYTIYLRNSSNSVIRNNRFRVSGTKKNTVAIGLSVSNDVLIEKNIFSEVETFIEKQGESSAREVGNESNSWWLF